jgi:uncharacterized protein (DUF983 family)
MMMEKRNLSSFEILLLQIDPPVTQEAISPLRKDSLCPQCENAYLDYNGLLQLECSACGFINGESGGCT